MAKERCGLTEHGNRVINNLSKGYQQRVGIAQAIIHSPDIVILDEPTVGLDPIQMIEIRKLIKELGETHSVMISSHILPEIQTLCDNVQIINQGKLIFNASIDQLNQQMQTQTLRMSCANSVDIKQIDALDSISNIQQTGNDLILHCHLRETSTEAPEHKQQEIIEISQQLIALAHKNHWGLYEIAQDKKSLEEIFMSLTRLETKAETGVNN